MTTCAIMSDMPKCKTVLEVGCGPGSHSLILASSFLNRDGGVLVSTDVSSKMIQKLKETYEEESDYGLIPSNKSFIDTKSDYSQFDEASSNILKNKCDIENIVQA
jgi:ubiquinone/menaquinone biosynthesis C-methylase UbiE